MFKVWTMGLVAASFLLAIFGTFITRSGIISSVHAYGAVGAGPLLPDLPGVAMLGFIGLIV